MTWWSFRWLGRRYKETFSSEHPSEQHRQMSQQHEHEHEQHEAIERLRAVADRLQAEMDVFRRDRNNNGTPRTSH